MYPRNAASPERISIGAVVQISDGAVQTAGVTVRVLPAGGTEADGVGTVAYSTDGVVVYTPTQAETNYTSFVLIAKKTGCIPASVTVVTSESIVSGRVYVATNGDKTGYTATVSDKTGFSLTPATGLGNQTANITGNLSGSVGSVTGAVGSVASFGTLVNDIATAVWGAATRTLTAFGFNVNLTPDTGLGAQNGSVATVGLVVELDENALTANDATDSITAAVWDAQYSAHTTAGTFGKLMDILRKSNTVVDGVVTSAITPTATSFSSNVNYPTGAFKHAVLVFIDSAAINEQNSPILGYVNTNGVFTVEEPFTVAPTAGDEFIVIPTTHVHSVAAIADGVWDEPTSGHTTAGTTGKALIDSGAAGNPWTTDLSTGYSGTEAGNILNQVKSQADLIQSGGTVYVTSPVTATGQLASPLIIGDDYLAANGRRFRWTVALPSGYVIATSTARFGMRYEDEQGPNSFIATGTVTDATGGNVHLDFDVAKTVTGTLRPGWYEWSVEIVSATGTEITRVKSGKNVEWQGKQT
jgi:hypothetical protein